jgi:uroporphyrinogen-III synthase
MTLRVLITRPRPDAVRLATALAARGVESVVASLTEIVFTPAPVPLDGVQAILVTSANGARALAVATPRRDVRVLAVGRASAEAARHEDFASVASADGDVHALAALARRTLDRGGGALLHASGADVAGDLAGTLAGDGFDARRVSLYEARTVAALPPEAVAALTEGAVQGVTLFSPRSADSFVRLLRDARLEREIAPLTAFCLSAAVAQAASGLAWRSVEIAARPDQEALVDIVAGAQ